MDAHTLLYRRLKRDLECPVERTERTTWLTTSSLPHEIRLHQEAGVQLVRVSAGMLEGVKVTKALLDEVNCLNIERAFCRRIVGDGKVLLVAEMPLASLRKGDLEHMVSMVHCLARLDAPGLAVFGGRSVANLPASALDLDRIVEHVEDLFRASGTATVRELEVWLSEWTDLHCWVDHDKDSVTVGLGTTGRINDYPFPLVELWEDVKELQRQSVEFGYE